MKVVIAESFERIHRSNLVGMGVVPLQFKPNENVSTLGLTGKERFTIIFPTELRPSQDIEVRCDNGKSFMTTSRVDT